MQQPHDESQKVTRIINALVVNKDIPEDSKADLINQISQLNTPLTTDPWVYRIVVLSLGLTVLGTVAGGFLLKLKTAADIPDGLIALGSAAVGALAGLLAPSPNRH